MTPYERARAIQALVAINSQNAELLDDAIRGMQSTDDPALCALHDALVEQRAELTSAKN